MPNNNGIITAPVSIGDVAGALGVQLNDLGKLCQSANVKKWAKYKPVKCGDVFTTDGIENWWKALDGNCGITNIPKTSTYTDMPTYYANIDSYFIRDVPESYFRLTDFDGYYHAAPKPITVPNSKIYVSNKQTETHLAKIYGLMSPVNDNVVRLSDMTIGEEYYFGAYGQNSDKTQTLIATSTGTVASLGSSVNIDFYAKDAGIWTFYPFLASKVITQGSVPPTGTIYIPIPDGHAVEVECVENEFVVTLNVLFDTQTRPDGATLITYTHYKVKITNYSSASKTFTLNLKIKKPSATVFYDDIFSGESMTVTANGGESEYEYKQTAYPSSYVENRAFNLRLYTGDDRYVIDKTVVMPPAAVEV